MADIRVLPAQEQRVETGAVRFGDDWPGVFIRGDNAFGYIAALDWAIATLAHDPSPSISLFTVSMLRGLRADLASSDLTGQSATSAATGESA
jgi:hypothetical protein